MQNDPRSREDEDPAGTGFAFPFFADGYCRKHLSPSCVDCPTRYGMPSVQRGNQGLVAHTDTLWLQGYVPAGPALGRRDNLQPHEVARPALPVAPTAPPSLFGPGSVTSAQSNPSSAISRWPAAIGPQQASVGSQGLAHSSGDINTQPMFAQRDSVASISQNYDTFLHSQLEGSSATASSWQQANSALIDAPNDVQMTGTEQPSVDEDNIARLLQEYVSAVPPGASSDSLEPLANNQATGYTAPPLSIAHPQRTAQNAQPSPIPGGDWRFAQHTVAFVNRDGDYMPQMDTAPPCLLLSRFCDIQIRVGIGTPILVRVPDIALSLLTEEFIPLPKNLKHRGVRRVRRVEVDAEGFLTKMNVPGSRWPTRLSQLITEDRTGGLKLTFFDFSKGPVPPEAPVQWPIPPTVDGSETVRWRVTNLAGLKG
jgi:hypothetical protein